VVSQGFFRFCEERENIWEKLSKTTSGTNQRISVLNVKENQGTSKSRMDFGVPIVITRFFRK
jgi:spore coat protein CotF